MPRVWRWTGADEADGGGTSDGKSDSGTARLKAPFVTTGKPASRRRRLDYLALAAWTSISQSMPGATSEATCMVTRAGLFGCSAVPKNIL